MSSKTTSMFPLHPARVHEVCGPGAHSFAAIVGSMGKGQVIWIAEEWQRARLNPGGLMQFCDPARFVFTYGKNHLDVLWIAEEALRSAVPALVVAEVTKPIDLTAGRRLQLAAEAGGVLGLFIVPEGMGSNSAETRWRCVPSCDDGNKDSTLFEWSCIKNKKGTLKSWQVRWDATSHHVHMAAATGERADFTAQAV